MPELSDRDNKPFDQFSQENEYQKRLAEIEFELGVLYDQAIEVGEQPIEFLYNFQKKSEKTLKEIYGETPVDDLIVGLQNLQLIEEQTDEKKNEFIKKVANLIQPLVESSFLHPEIKSKIEKIEQEKREKIFEAGKLKVIKHLADWDIALSDGTKIFKNEDTILEINYPDEMKVSGLKELEKSFAEIADILRENEGIKAVIGVSWMMSAGLTDKLGFEKFSNLEISEDQMSSILTKAQNARQAKSYSKQIDKNDVLVGVISREQFLYRYG